MIKLKQWNDTVTYLSSTYDISFGYNDNEQVLPSTTAQLKNAWFTCPECDEPIYYEDWADEEWDIENVCPICAFHWSEVSNTSVNNHWDNEVDFNGGYDDTEDYSEDNDDWD